MTTDTITLADEYTAATYNACERHDAWPLHTTAECPQLAGVSGTHRIDCSVCDLPWGEGAYSQHEHCAWISSAGERHYAEPAMYVHRAGDWIRVVRE